MAKQEWYIVKRKAAQRWQAYKLKERPELKRGYEMRGPYRSLAECLMAANK